MKVGHARIDITPEEGSTFYLLGYKHPCRMEPAKGIHDHIYSNSLLFEINGKRAFIWTADLLELEDEMVEDVKNKLYSLFLISPEQVILGVTHDHSSIRDYHKNWDVGDFSQEYYDFLVDSIIASFRECEYNLQDASIRIGKKVVEGFYSNRNHPGELADNEIIVVKFHDVNNNPFAAIVNWAVHSTCLGAENSYLTGDLAGNTCRKLKEKWGYYPLMLNGAAGDSSNRNDRKGKDFEELERATAGLADEISKIETNQEVIGDNILNESFVYNIRPNISEYRKYLETILKDLCEDVYNTVDNMPVSHLIDKCEAQLALPVQNQDIACNVLDIAGLRFYVFPGELGSKLGILIKESSKKPALIAGYSDGFHHYFFAKEDYGLSFETIGNPVPPGIPEEIVKKFIETGKKMDEIYSFRE